MTGAHPMDPTDAFHEISLLAFSETGVDGLLNQLAEPDFAALALDAGCLSCLSVGLPVQASATGALNLYATEPRAFDEEAVTVAQTFAGFAAVALANAHLHNAQANLADHLRTAVPGPRQ